MNRSDLGFAVEIKITAKELINDLLDLCLEIALQQKKYFLNQN